MVEAIAVLPRLTRAIFASTSSRLSETKLQLKALKHAKAKSRLKDSKFLLNGSFIATNSRKYRTISTSLSRFSALG